MSSGEQALRGIIHDGEREYQPAIKATYERLRAAGKPPKVARCAAARKLLHLAFAVVSKREPFDPTYHTREVAKRMAAEAAKAGAETVGARPPQVST